MTGYLSIASPRMYVDAPLWTPSFPPPLPGQRAGAGNRPPNPAAGALLAECRTVTASAHGSPT